MKQVPYTYAGFRFIIYVTDDGTVLLNAEAEPGQHPAAYKDKHRRNAAQSYIDDQHAADTTPPTRPAR